MTLLAACNVRDLEHAEQIFDRHYPEDEMKVRAVREIEEWLDGERSAPGG